MFRIKEGRCTRYSAPLLFIGNVLGIRKFVGNPVFAISSAFVSLRGGRRLRRPFRFDTPPRPGGVKCSESLKGCALVSGSGANRTAGRLEGAAGR